MDWNESILFVVQLNGKNSFERLYMLWKQQTLYDYSLQHYKFKISSVMKTRVLFQILLSVSLFVSTACYGQTKYELKDFEIKREGYDLQGTLQVDESYDKQTKMLTLTIKNEYKHDIFLYQSITPHLFVYAYYKEDRYEIPISVSGDLKNKKKIINPDSTHVISIDCQWLIDKHYEQVSFHGAFPCFFVNEKEEAIASGSLWREEKRFDL